MVEECVTEFDMTISARNLKNPNLLGKSDPICIISEFNKKANSWEIVAQTKPLKNQLNPDWLPVRMKYFFEKV
jgi:hypothetical protein